MSATECQQVAEAKEEEEEFDWRRFDYYMELAEDIARRAVRGTPEYAALRQEWERLLALALGR